MYRVAQDVDGFTPSSIPARRGSSVAGSKFNGPNNPEWGRRSRQQPRGSWKFEDLKRKIGSKGNRQSSSGKKGNDGCGEPSWSTETEDIKGFEKLQKSKVLDPEVYTENQHYYESSKKDQCKLEDGFRQDEKYSGFYYKLDKNGNSILKVKTKRALIFC